MKISNTIKDLFSFTKVEDQNVSTLFFEATTKLIDGKDVRIEGDLKEGAKVFLVTDETEIPMPDGTDWTLIDGTVLETKDGMIVSITEKPSGDQPVEETPIEEPTPEVETEPVMEPGMEPNPVSEPTSEPVQNVTSEDKTKELETKISDLEQKLNDLVAKIDTMSAEFEKTTTDFTSKFERVVTVEPVKQVEKVILTSKTNSNLGSYDEVYKK